MKREKPFDATHQLIIGTATELFLENGFKNTSTRDIAKAAQITQPALYYHFSNKEELFIEINRQIGQKIAVKLREIEKKELPIEEKLIAATKAFLTIYHRDIFSFIHQSASDMESDHKMALYEILNTYYLVPLQNIIKTSDQDAIDVNKASKFYLMSLSLLFGNAHVLSSEKEQKESIKEVVQLVLYGILSKK